MIAIGGEVGLLNSEALTKIQSIILIAVIVVAAVGGGAAYVLWSGQEETSETIKIGVCADIDNSMGKCVLQGAKLAAEKVNAEGGVLGMNFEIVAKDDDSETGEMDLIVATNAMTRLVTVDEADFIISLGYGLTYREIAFEHTKILFTTYESMDELTQGVLDNYDRYKYYFRAGSGNNTAGMESIIDSIVACRNHTSFNKVAFIYWFLVEDFVSSMTDSLEKQGFDVVLSAPITDVLDFSSAFAKVEEAGAEILFPIIFGTAGIQFVKEYYERQSPMVMWGNLQMGATNEFWEITEGKCEHMTCGGYSIVAGYPLTTKTLPTKDAYLERWGEEITSNAAVAYDIVRFILADAIERAGTTETEAVIKALEETDIETSLVRHFVFSSSHDIMSVKGPEQKDYFFTATFQWQDGVLVPVYPIEMMNEVGASYTFPPWPGPWDNIS
jgi:branched-chain amino acid transport system substrate-binding protein